MKVLLVNTKEGAGGAGIAARRLLHALQHHGHEAQMMVRLRETDDSAVLSLPSAMWGRTCFIMERLGVVLRNRGSRQRLFAIDPGTWGTDLRCTEAFRRADVVHLHWINQGMLSLKGLGQLLETEKRIVWTLHDMWPFTGICHHADTCGRWLENCGECRLLQHPSAHDLSYDTFCRKRDAYARGRLHIVTCSDWLANLARQAPLLAGCDIHSIPNPLDTDFYQPGDKLAARQRLGIPCETRLLLFVAYKVTDEMKGSSYVRRAMEQLVTQDADLRGDSAPLGIALVGHGAETMAQSIPAPTYPYEYVSNEALMRDLYQAADLLVMPTLMDNLPNTVAEAMACGTPVVAFRIGGLPQMICHDEDGYLADYKSLPDFVEGIRHILLAPHYDAYSQAARRHAVEAYSEAEVVRRYLEVYG